MPIPEGFITTSDIWQVNPDAKLEDADIPFEKIEEPEEDDEDKRQEIALKIHKGEL